MPECEKHKDLEMRIRTVERSENRNNERINYIIQEQKEMKEAIEKQSEYLQQTRDEQSKLVMKIVGSVVPIMSVVIAILLAVFKHL